MAEFDPLIAKCRTARILKFLVNNGISTIRQIAKYLGNITENALYRFMSQMKHNGLVIDCGFTKGVEYRKGRTSKLWKATQDPKVMQFVTFLECV